MTSWKPYFSPELLYFVTTSFHSHKDYLNNNATKQIILDIFDCYRRQGQIMLYSFVLMPTHIHFISRIQGTSSLADFMRNFKSLSSSRIRRYFQAIQYNKIWNRRKIWEEGYVAKEIYSLPFLEQKVNYIHENPCKLPWKFVDLPEDYPWSSAIFYLTNEPCIIPIDDFRDYFIV